MDSDEKNKDLHIGDDKSESQDLILSADDAKPKEDKEDVVELNYEGRERRDTLKPAFALFWAMRKLRSLPAGANKKTIAGVLSTRFEHEQDPNFEKKVEMVLTRGVQFGMLEQYGDRYCLNEDYNREMSRRDREERRFRLRSAPESSHLDSISARDRSPCTNSLSSETSSEETEGVEVIEWALNKLNDRRGSSEKSIMRMVGTKYKRTYNFDQQITEALEDAIAAKKVVKEGNRYRLLD